MRVARIFRCIQTLYKWIFAFNTMGFFSAYGAIHESSNLQNMRFFLCPHVRNVADEPTTGPEALRPLLLDLNSI